MADSCILGTPPDSFGVLLWGPSRDVVAAVLVLHAAPAVAAGFAVCGPDGFNGSPGDIL